MQENLISEFRTDSMLFDHKIYKLPSEDSFFSHSHAACEFLYFLRGQASYYIEGRIYKLKKHDLVIVRPTMFHYLLVEGEEDYERYNMSFDMELLPKELAERFEHTGEMINCAEHEGVKDLFERLDRYCETMDADMMKTLFPALAQELFCLCIASDADACARMPLSADPLVRKALKYIHAHLCTISGMDELCRELYVTKSHLHHVFIQNLRTSPMKYIREKRLHLAQKELGRGAYAADVCRRCGFSDYTSFYRNYKAFFGYPPSFENKEI